MSNEPMISSLTIYLTLLEDCAHELLAILNTLMCLLLQPALASLPNPISYPEGKQLTHHSLLDNNL